MSLTFAVIGTFYGRHPRTLPLLKRVLVESTFKPDEFWIMCETQQDADVAAAALEPLWPGGVVVQVLETPRAANGRYAEIPYSRKINYALDRTACDVVCYLDNGSTPHPEKYRVMVQELERNPIGAGVYVTQHRTGYLDEIHYADRPIANGYGQVNYTQVMHFLTDDRWTLDMAYANPDLADAVFWGDLNRRGGPFYPAALDGVPAHVLDEHHMPSPAAAGV